MAENFADATKKCSTSTKATAFGVLRCQDSPIVAGIWPARVDNTRNSYVASDRLDLRSVIDLATSCRG